MLCTPWAQVSDVLGDGSASGCAPCGDLVSEDAVAKGITVASENLYHLTGNRYRGLCEATVRPCAQDATHQGLPGWPWLLRSSWDVSLGLDWWTWHTSWGTCRCGLGPMCSCERLPRVGLGKYPIRAIDEVWVDGVKLDTSAYRLVNKRWLDRIDGGRWPFVQDLTTDDLTQPNTFGVVLKYGRAVPAGGAIVAAAYACELAKAMCGDETCQLPSRVVQVLRQGTTVQFESLSVLVRDRRVGLHMVDTWVDAVNGGRRAMRPLQFISPDVNPETYG